MQFKWRESERLVNSNFTKNRHYTRRTVLYHGSDLLLGVKEYCKSNNEQTVELYDVCHMVALELKKLLMNDPDWAVFSSRAAETDSFICTREVHLAPPNQRRKGRYMNVDILIGWANKILSQRQKYPLMY